MSVDAQLPEIIPLLYKNAPAFRQRLDGAGLKPAEPLAFPPGSNGRRPNPPRQPAHP
jgi:hypothetical protein